RLIACI
ncbi:hypothetical protein D018_1765B, partial [Vibrio parahaemolyticus VP2007-007]